MVPPCATILPGGRGLEIGVATFEFGLRYPEAYRIVPIVVAMGTDFSATRPRREHDSEGKGTWLRSWA